MHVREEWMHCVPANKVDETHPVKSDPSKSPRPTYPEMPARGEDRVVGYSWKYGSPKCRSTDSELTAFVFWESAQLTVTDKTWTPRTVVGLRLISPRQTDGQTLMYER